VLVDKHSHHREKQNTQTAHQLQYSCIHSSSSRNQAVEEKLRQSCIKCWSKRLKSQWGCSAAHKSM